MFAFYDFHKMKDSKMYEDKPDRFGKYRDKIVRIHNLLCTKICDEFSLDISLVEMPIHQMSIFEYISEKHDEDYTYFFIWN